MEPGNASYGIVIPVIFGDTDPVHDAVLIEAPLEELEARVKESQELMREASRQVLGGFELTTDADVYRYPERYRDEERGGKFWDKVMDLLSKTKFS